jgi:hypothetical protein
MNWRDWFDIAVIVGCVLLVLLPPKYDPAIRLREWLDKDEDGGR